MHINVLGVKISAVNLDQALVQIQCWIDRKERHYVNLCTVHTIMECRRSRALMDIVNAGGMALPDGMPLVWLNHFYGFKNAGRVYGPDLMLALCEHSETRGYRHFFYGGAEGVAQELAAVLQKRYPGLQVAGAHSPPYRPASEIEDGAIIERINSTRPDVVWVGLGTPKQDFWVAQHRPLLEAPVLVAVGAAFDFHAGRVRQAPQWMQRNGLEWLFRLALEPRRLAYRYLIYNPLFIMYTLCQLTGFRKYDLGDKQTGKN